jgi:signal peptidase II
MQERRRQKLIKEVVFFTTAVVVIALDQISKFLIRANRATLPVPEEGFFRITYATNTGGAFGIFANQAFLISLIAIAGIVTILFYVRYSPLNTMPVRIALGLLLGGTAGNLIDRLCVGQVVDFIDVGFGQYRWPTFNIADSAIVVSVIILLYYFLFQFGRREPIQRKSG